MGDEDGGQDLPQRVRDVPRSSPRPPSLHPPGSPPAPLLSAELRQRLQAAVTAERSEAAVREQDRPAGGEVTIPAARTGISPDRLRRPAGPDRAARPGRAANAGPVAEDEGTEWLGTASGPASVVGTPSVAGSPSVAQPRSAQAGPDQPGSAGWLGAGIAALVVIPALVIGSLTVIAVRHFTGTSASSRASAAAARQEAAARGKAAAWIAQQVGPGVAVSCDQAMSAALAARGIPARDLLVLGPLSPDPRQSVVVVETAAVQALFGTSLDLAWAPDVLGSFGSGFARITVRVVASHGAVAYQTALAADLAARKAAGARLLADRRISIPAAARAQLTAGLVDLRLLSALTDLSRHLRVSLVDFGNVGQGASAGVPLRFADLSQAGQASQTRSYLSQLDSTIRPVRTVPVVLPDGQAMLRVEFTAPSPLAVPGMQSSP